MILVTGATGFLGSFICRKLHQQGKEFIALKRASSKLDLLSDIKDQIKWHEGDVTEINTIEEIIDQVDTVIHSAAVVSYHASDKDLMDEVNIQGTKKLIDLCLINDIKKFIHISSVAALGRNKHEGRVDEKTKWQNSKWNTNYGESKHFAELEVWRGIVEGLNAVILNPSVVLGPGDWDRSSSTIFKYVWKEKPFYTEGLVNYVDVRDVVSAVMYLLDHPDKYGERYILNAGNVTFKTLFDEIAKRFNKKAPSVKAKPQLVKLGLFAEWIKSFFSNKKPMITRETARLGNSQIYFDNTKAVKELNHTFASLSDTLDWTCAYYLDNKI
ncbi:SDR family NAD(P)-dependent oxidoreductase [Fulvivirga sp. RKSG066]|uniref:SDR family NAD(P)-dependent oxidoreductase n=1 Tax=Fulvivirga aurantia TaxID=2529383 RepID=UPI0012BD17E2|nr:SDR family NAD(P)-dependent oxidoreductase [Fulvivirga aurantia]MTI22247.1 SDR family NAD(P)-dependent oxidoreductase [Fulvivirga aurantia]